MQNTKQRSLLEFLFLTRSHNDRLIITAGTCLVLLFIWTVFFVLPTKSSRSQVSSDKFKALSETTNNNAQAEVLKERIKVTKKQILQNKNSALAQKQAQLQAQRFTSLDADKLIKQLFNVDDKIHGVTVQSQSINTAGQVEGESVAKQSPNAPANSIQNFIFSIQFNADYFATIDYLTKIERLSWCLNWDTLNFKVLNYPESVVNLKVITVNEI